ncbi:MAG: ATP-binding protein [Oscillospiraceae bacterium]|nr:ATP-binding protein [Oscillospiraceae bacterium]
MMDELSLNILDIAQNSIAANATLVEIRITENDPADTLSIGIKDNGKGMSPEFLKTVEDPFITTRTTRKIGLGISFFKEAAEMTGGNLSIISALGVGTTITATFQKSHIDRQPIGDLTGTIIALVTLNPDIDFIVTYTVNSNEFLFSTVEVKEMLGGDVALSNPEVATFLTEYINENIENLHN